MDEDSDIISDPEPIPDEDPPDHEPTPEQDTPDSGDDEGFWQVERAREELEQAVQEASEDPGAPFERDTLEAAATLQEKSRADFERFKSELQPYVNLNQWPSVVGDVADDLEVKEARQSTSRPTIFKGEELHVAEQQCCEALRDLDGVYERSGEVVEVYEGPEGVEIAPVADKDRLASLLSQAARFEKHTKAGPKQVDPPRRVVGSVYSRHSWGLDHLRGLVDGAAFLEDGTLLTTQGYHPDSELYLRGGADISGLKSPTQEDADRAREILVDLLVDFEFVDERREAHEAAWLAAVLTILARPAIGRKASTPMFLFDANRPGVGKTSLVELACEIAQGKLPSPRPSPTGRNSNDQMRKAITSAARSGDPVIFFDNVKGKMGGGALELALTGKKWTSRILQKSKDWSGHLMVTWLATSNNVTLTSDMERRTLLCQIHTLDENPSEREDFKYPRIHQHVRQHRDRYLKAALTILRAWYVAGEPEHGLTSWGSFQEWSRIVRNSIVFAGGADPYRTRQDLEDADRDTRLLRSVLRTWPKGESFTATELAEGMKEGSLPNDTLETRSDDVIGPLQELLGTKAPSHVSRKLGYYEGRVEEGLRLERFQDSDTRRTKWKVTKTSNANER